MPWRWVEAPGMESTILLVMFHSFHLFASASPGMLQNGKEHGGLCMRTQKCNTRFITSLARTHWPYLPEGKTSGNGGHSQAPRKGKSFVTCLSISATLALEERGVHFTEFLRVFCQHRLSSGLPTSLQRSCTLARPEKLGRSNDSPSSATH